MNSKTAGALPLALLILLAGLSFWLEQISNYSPEAARKASMGEPDFIMDRFRAVQTNVQGVPIYTVRANQLKHYASADFSELFHAELHDYTPLRPPLMVNAEYAKLQHQQDELTFSKKVVMVREASTDTSRLTLTTTAMTVLPKQGKAFGNEALDLRDDAMHVTAVGFDMDKNARLIRLHSRVRAVYVLPKQGSH